MNKHAVILVRLSQKVGDEGGLERQEEDCRAYCERLGLPVAAVHREVQSAWEGKTRPVLERALSEAAGGALIVWKIDRLTRRGVIGLGGLLDRLSRDRTVLHSVTEAIDAGSPMGRSVLGVLAGVAEQSSADASLRIRRAFEENARQGRRHGGGGKRFGWGEGEADLVREAAAWITSGGSLRSLAGLWNERGVKSPTGGLWGASSISRLLRNESLIGVRVHLNERYKGDWEPLLTEAEFSALGAALRRNKKSPKGEATLLGGLLRCGACGSRMRSAPAAKKGGGLRYGCLKEPGRGGCSGVYIMRHLADAEVERQVGEMWEIWSEAAPIPRIDPTQRLAEERQALNDLVHDHYVLRLLGRDQFLPAYQALTDRIAELEADITVDESTVVTTLEQKIKACVSHVEVFPVGRTGVRKAVSERVRVHFRFGWLSQRALLLG